MDSIEILQPSSPPDIETGAGAGAGAGAGDMQVATTPLDLIVTLIAQMALSVATKTLGPVGPNVVHSPLFKVYTVVNLTTFIIDLILISYFALNMLSSAVTPTTKRMAVVKILIWAAMALSFISFLLGSSLLLSI